MSGIIGVYSADKKNIANELFYGLTALQHRGEEGCGISVNDGTYFHTMTSDGLVYYFIKDHIENLKKMNHQKLMSWSNLQKSRLPHLLPTLKQGRLSLADFERRHSRQMNIIA